MEMRLVVSPSPNTAAALPVSHARVEALGALPEEEREAEAQRLALETATQPFDLERGPLLRARLLRLRESEHWLVLTLHHIVTDGWSSGVLRRELSVLYQAFHEGKP